MPGYVIHLAVGKVYSKENNIDNIESFEKQVKNIKEEIAIIELIGNNGRISEKEPVFNKNILDKYKKVD